MLKYGIINPLNVHGLRQVKFCPPHFTKFYFDAKTTDDRYTICWILENLESRFFIESLTSDSHIRKCVAFEDSSEAALFALQIDKINVQENFF
jgi:hypothetical protein